MVRLWRSPRRWPPGATNPVQIRWKSHVFFPFSWGRWLSLIRRNRWLWALVLESMCRMFYQVSRCYKGRQEKCRYRTSSELEKSVLEINHVTNVTKVLNETTASDRVSRRYHDSEATSTLMAAALGHTACFWTIIIYTLAQTTAPQTTHSCYLNIRPPTPTPVAVDNGPGQTQVRRPGRHQWRFIFYCHWPHVHTCIFRGASPRMWLLDKCKTARLGGVEVVVSCHNNQSCSAMMWDDDCSGRAFSTFNSNLVPLIQDHLCTSLANPAGFEFSVLWWHRLLSFSEKAIFYRQKAVSPKSHRASQHMYVYTHRYCVHIYEYRDYWHICANI